MTITMVYTVKRKERFWGMIQREDILSMEYLKKTEFTGCHQGMRYRLEGVTGEDLSLIHI